MDGLVEGAFPSECQHARTVCRPVRAHVCLLVSFSCGCSDHTVFAHGVCTVYVHVSGPSVWAATMVCSGCLHCSPIQCLKVNSYSLYCYISTYNMHDSNLMTICPCTVIMN